ncbi:MAG: metal-sulfur cluster assembly factor [Rubrobacteraceae bacterium]
MEQAVSPTKAMVSREVVIEALGRCYDPCCREREISVVDMGLIESIETTSRKVDIKMVLTTGWCPFAARLLEMIETAVGELEQVDEIDVEVVWNPAWTPQRMSEGAREKLRLPLQDLIPLREARLREEKA